MTTSSAILWASRRVWADGSSNFFDAIRRNSGEVRSYSRISTSVRSARQLTSPCRPACAPAEAKLAKAARTAAGSEVGIGGTSETTLKSEENVRSRAVTWARPRPRFVVSGPLSTAKLGTTMLSFLAPVASTLRSTSAPCERAGVGEESAPAVAASSASAAMTPRGRPGRSSQENPVRIMRHPSSAATDVEGEQHAERRLRPVVRQLRKGARRHHRAERRVVVVGVSRALGDRGGPDRAIPLALDVDLGLLLGLVGLIL